MVESCGRGFILSLGWLEITILLICYMDYYFLVILLDLKKTAKGTSLFKKVFKTV